MDDQNETVEPKVTNQKSTKVAWKVCNMLQVWWVTNLFIEPAFVKKKRLKTIFSIYCYPLFPIFIINFIQFVWVQVVMLLYNFDCIVKCLLAKTCTISDSWAARWKKNYKQIFHVIHICRLIHVGNCLRWDLLYLHRNLSTLWTSVLPFENGNSLLGE